MEPRWRRIVRLGPWLSAAWGLGLAISVTPGTRAAPRDEAQLPAPVLPAVQSLLDAGRADAALDALDGDDAEASSLERLLLRARVAERAATGDAAADWLAVAAQEPELQGVARRRALEALLRSGRRDEAEDLARAGAGTEGRALVLRVAEARAAAGEHVGADALFASVLQLHTDGVDADRARIGSARALAAQGRVDDAMARWREAQTRMRNTETFRVARNAERALGASSGRPLPPFDEATFDDLSRRLAAASRFEDALDLIGEWQRAFPDSIHRHRIESRRISALYNLRRNGDARTAAHAFLKGEAPQALKADMAVMLFRLAVRDGLAAEAAERGRAIGAGRVTGVAPGERRSVASLLANYWLSIGHVDDALTLYRELYTTSPELGDKRAFLLRLCVAAVRVGQHTRAVTNLRALLALNPQGDARVGAEYWLGVALEGAGEREAAIVALADVEDAYRFSYYGLRATQRLDDLAARGLASRDVVSRARAARAATPLFPDMVLASATTARRDFQAASALARAGLVDEAARLYRALAGRFTRDDALSLLAARAAAAANDHRAAVGLVMSHFPDVITHGAEGEPDDLRALAYPRPFWTEVQEAAARARVPPRLLLSLMRRESRFDPRARSAVGALGLFQIMPYTATELGPALGLSPRTDEDVLEPRVNAALAAALVGRLTALFGTALPPLVASYNAGEDRVGDWWRASAKVPDDIFVEIIPYAETRGFVREVLANHAAYGRLYDERSTLE